MSVVSKFAYHLIDIHLLTLIVYCKFCSACINYSFNSQMHYLVQNEDAKLILLFDQYSEIQFSPLPLNTRMLRHLYQCHCSY